MDTQTLFLLVEWNTELHSRDGAPAVVRRFFGVPQSGEFLIVSWLCQRRGLKWIIGRPDTANIRPPLLEPPRFSKVNRRSTF